MKRIIYILLIILLIVIVPLAFYYSHGVKDKNFQYDTGKHKVVMDSEKDRKDDPGSYAKDVFIEINY